MWIYGQDPIKVTYQPAKFGGHKYSDRGDIVVIVCHVISQTMWQKGRVSL